MAEKSFKYYEFLQYHSMQLWVCDCMFVCVLRERETWDFVISNSRMNQLSNGTLEISNVSYNDTGLYTCSVGEDKLSITAELEVLSE